MPISKIKITQIDEDENQDTSDYSVKDAKKKEEKTRPEPVREVAAKKKPATAKKIVSKVKKSANSNIKLKSASKKATKITKEEKETAPEAAKEVKPEAPKTETVIVEPKREELSSFRQRLSMIGIIKEDAAPETKVVPEAVAPTVTTTAATQPTPPVVSKIAQAVKIDDSKPDFKIVPGPAEAKAGAVKTAVTPVVTDSELVEEVKKDRKSISLYKKLAVVFIILTLGLFGVVFYFAYAKVDIVLIPNQERKTGNLIVDIIDQNKTSGNLDALKGVVADTAISDVMTCTSSDEELLAEEMSGKVIVYNNYIKNQPLVATTRLLSSGGKLFRIKDTVNVPAGGSIEVGIYADDKTLTAAVEPTKFTIPGLWAGLQDKIYAENKETISYSKKVKHKVAAADLDACARLLKGQIIDNAKTKLGVNYPGFDQLLFKLDETSITSVADAKEGEEKESFSVNMTAKVVVVAFDGVKAGELAQKKFISSLPTGKELIDFNKSNIAYSLDNYDVAQGTASVNTTFEGRLSIKDFSNIIPKQQLLGLSKSKLDAFLSSKPEIAGFEVKFTPAFYKKVPNLPDRINITIKK